MDDRGLHLEGLALPMHSAQAWDLARFHTMLASRLELVGGEHVLDLGCGRGLSLGPLLDAVGQNGHVVGLDQAASSLSAIRHRHSADMLAGRLSLVRGQAIDLPLDDGTFDAVLCQNVVECVVDRPSLVAHAERVLKPGGRLLLGHHDFDGVMLASDDRDFDRRLVRAFADHQQAWQEASEGRMGRLLPGLVSAADFAETRIEAQLFIDLDFRQGSYARDYIGWLVSMAPALGFDQDEVSRWADRLRRGAEEGRFFFGLPWIGAFCRKRECTEPISSSSANE